MFYLHKQAWVLVNSLVVRTLILQLMTFGDLGNSFPKVWESLFLENLVVDICSLLLRPHVICYHVEPVMLVNHSSQDRPWI